MSHLELCPLSLKDAQRIVTRVHRHHRAPVGGLFAVGVMQEGRVIGCAIIGRPVARGNQDGYTAEVTRLSVEEGRPNACSMLYGAAWRAARALGYRRLITYTLKREKGTSVLAAGWTAVGEVRGRSWHCASRPRVDGHPIEPKVRWEANA